MTSIIITTLCGLLLIAYLFDLTTAKTKIPSVIFLLVLGWLVRQVINYFNVATPDLSTALPILGTIGLILIVLEGALELELKKSKAGIIKKSLLGGFLAMLAVSFALTGIFCYFGGTDFKQTLINVIPLSVISSAIAIPSVRNLTSMNREFVIYESSFSDILGVLFFNFIVLNETFGFASFTSFGIELFLMIVVSFVASLVLAFLMSKIEHHVKFAPIILLILLIYSLSKIFHLPALLFILLFGLFVGNLEELKRFSWIARLKPEEMDVEVRKFKEITSEGTFLVRSLFFLLFGYIIESSEIFDVQTLVWAGAVVGVVFLVRLVQLYLSKLPLMPLLFIAPRGLITILLFLSVTVEQRIGMISRSLLIQVIVLTALVMMVGLMLTKKKEEALDN